jgi:hypothetical protein
MYSLHSKAGPITSAALLAALRETSARECRLAAAIRRLERDLCRYSNEDSDVLGAAWQYLASLPRWGGVFRGPEGGRPASVGVLLAWSLGRSEVLVAWPGEEEPQWLDASDFTFTFARKES